MRDKIIPKTIQFLKDGDLWRAFGKAFALAGACFVLMKIKYLGDTAIIIYYENHGNTSLFIKVQRDYALLKNAAHAGILDIVPCYNSIGVYFDPELTDLAKVHAFITDKLSAAEPPQLETGRIIHIPVYYGGSYGPDLPAVAESLTSSVNRLGQSNGETR